MTPEQKLLYDQIVQFKLDQPGVLCPFSTKLAWQYGWSGVFTLRAIREYKKFIFLIMVSEQRLSPATVIDRVWHQHILYTQSYWIDFCEKLLKRQIHHTPGLGGEEEGMKYYRQCDRALTLYQQHFGDPPADIWNPPQTTVETLDYQWVNRAKNWVISKPTIGPALRLSRRTTG
ncbi:hypothetical protein S7335_2447 [Synechococcus sp. PCC 7335]|uniref:glycine-rich domain-containing protein n=1 Tax=Synechococcus sp. (strain ATCC 29403 / PCC 7335) TaxID=91464 RepID=UPI00017EE002|nr:hypothetical protein [Synechococcus sp. PCC 7335]EDX84750.1 hypothetical protein S7335_2447 [Synechococcus sp. PCC 7335]